MKKTICVLLVIIVLFSITSLSYASNLSDIKKGADNFIQAANGQGDKIPTKNLQDLSSTIYNVLLVIAIIASVIVGIVLGIKFMFASGAEGKAEIKQALVPYIVGMAVVFGAFGIWKIVVNVLKSIS